MQSHRFKNLNKFKEDESKENHTKGKHNQAIENNNNKKILKVTEDILQTSRQRKQKFLISLQNQDTHTHMVIFNVLKGRGWGKL